MHPILPHCRHGVTATMGVKSKTEVQGTFPNVTDVHQAGCCWLAPKGAMSELTQYTT